MKSLFTKVFLFLLLAMSTAATAHAIEEKPIVVLITSFNNAEWYKRNLQSVFMQKYSNYRVVYVDDISPDGTADLVEAYVKNAGQEHRFTLIRNAERRLALANIYFSVHDCDDHEIIVSLDGDDWLSNNQVLARINAAYTNEVVWLTHGTMQEFPSGVVGWSIPIPDNIVKANAFREYRCPSHLRTFYAWLFKKIEIDDLLYEGEFYEMTWDMAMMYPMIEMAGERHKFMKDVSYVYNMRTPLNDNKVNAALQQFYDVWIRSRPRYERLDDSQVPVH